MKQNVKIILISGKQGSGKTTLSKALEEWSEKNLWTFKPIKFADTLYEMHDAVLGILSRQILNNDDCKIKIPKKDGTLLQLLGTEWGRKVYGDDLWVNLTRAKVDRLLGIYSGLKKNIMIVIDDCRFMNELMAFPDAHKVRLHCDRDVRKARCDSWRDNENHPSETGFDHTSSLTKFDSVFLTHMVPVDYIVDNLRLRYLTVDREQTNS